VKKQLHSKRISQCCLARMDTLHPIQTQNLSTQSPDIVSSTCVSWLMPLQFTDCSRLRLGRYDWMAKKNFFNGYFLWTTIGYGVGKDLSLTLGDLPFLLFVWHAWALARQKSELLLKYHGIAIMVKILAQLMWLQLASNHAFQLLHSSQNLENFFEDARKLRRSTEVLPF